MIDWESMPNLKDLSLIVPTFNRQRHVLNQIKFWSGSNVNLFIIDGSEEPIPSDFDDLKNIHYMHMPNTKIEDRYLKVLDFIDSKYCMLMSDDEFFIPRALENCVVTLKWDADYVTCGGRCLGFCASNGKILGKDFNPKLNRHNINGESAKERMYEHFHPYRNSTIYSVARSDVWKNNFMMVAKRTKLLECPYFSEIQIEIGNGYQGKSVFINELMWLRNMGNDAVCSSGGFDRGLTIGKIEKHPLKSFQVFSVYMDTARDLARIDGADETEVYFDFLSAVDSYWTKWGANNPRDAFRNWLFGLFPSKFKYFVENVNAVLYWDELVHEAEKMENDGVIVDMDQLVEIIGWLS